MSFHHSAIKQILNITWNQVREKPFKNQEKIRGLLCNIPNIETLENFLNPTKNPIQFFSAAWIPREKNGHPQLTYNNHDATLAAT